MATVTGYSETVVVLGVRAVRSALEPPPQPQLGSPNMKIFSLPIKMSFWLNEYFISIKLREGV